MQRITWLAALCLVVALAIPGNDRADAYSFLRTSLGTAITWDLGSTSLPVSGGRVLYSINAAGCEDSAQFTGGIDEFAAIRAAFERHNSLDETDLRWRYMGLAPSDAGYDGTDDQNVVFFDDSSNPHLSTGIFGMAITTFTTGTGGGTIVDADMALNDDYDWDTIGAGTSGASGQVYIEAVATHEIGHMAGLDHSFVRQATMYPTSPAGSIRNYWLHPDDIAGLGLRYGTPTFTNDYGSLSGSVAGPSGDAFAVQVAAIDVASLAVVAAALTDTQGDYTIVGLPPGDYHLYASPVVTANLSGYYSSAETDILAQLHGLGTGTNGEPDRYRVTAGDTVEDGDTSPFGGTYDTTFTLEDKPTPGPFEPANDATATAPSVLLNDALVGRIETGADADYYKITVADGDSLDLVVVGSEAGSPLDARLTVYESNGTTRLISPQYGTSGYLPEADDGDDTAYDQDGEVLDPQVFQYTVPAGKGGALYVRVTSSFTTTGHYTLFLRRPADDPAPDAVQSTLVVSPPSIAATSGTDAVVTVQVRNRFGAAVTTSPGVTVHAGATNITATEPTAGSGIYTATVTNPGAAQDIPISATVDPSGSAIVLMTTATLYVTDTLDAGQSAVTVKPASLFADGSSTAQIRVQPRDIAGRPIYAAGASVVITSTAGTVGPTSFDTDTGDTTAALTAPSTPGTATVSASIDGTLLSDQPTVTFDDKVTSAPPSTGGGEDDGGICAVTPGSSATPLWLLVGLLTLGTIAWRRRTP